MLQHIIFLVLFRFVGFSFRFDFFVSFTRSCFLCATKFSILISLQMIGFYINSRVNGMNQMEYLVRFCVFC